MSDTPERELASAIVHDAAHRYIESRRARLDDFVDRHFTFSGALALHRRALGWDLLRAPANLFLAGPALALKLMAWAARRGRMEPTALWLARRRLLLETDVAREIEWLVATELFEIPYRRRNRVSDRDAIAQTILADERATQRLAATVATREHTGPGLRSGLIAAIEAYSGSRTATAELATGFVAAGLGGLSRSRRHPGWSR